MYPRAGEGTAWRVLQRDRLADLNHQYAQVTYDDTVFVTHKKFGGSGFCTIRLGVLCGRRG